MLSIKESTLTRMLGVSQEWERDQGRVNEGAYVLKHKGLYYLTYSANHFESPAYGIGYATSNSPMGPWTKYAYNPILQSNTLVHGAGHHSITESPDGSELFLVYHTHNSLTQVGPRRLGIDRLQFIPRENGPDVLEAWGPTVTPQAMPSTGNATIVRKRSPSIPFADRPRGKISTHFPPHGGTHGLFIGPGQRIFNTVGRQIRPSLPNARGAKSAETK